MYKITIKMETTIAMSPGEEQAIKDYLYDDWHFENIKIEQKDTDKQKENKI